MFSRLLLVFAFLLAGCALFAQSAPPSPAQEPSNQALLDQIQQLQKRLTDMEEHQRKTDAALAALQGAQGVAEKTTAEKTAQLNTPALPAGAEHPVEHSTGGHDHAEIREATIHYPSLQIRGFGDVDFAATDQKGTTSGFDLGQFVLHFASPLSAKVSYFGEVSFTAEPSTYDVSVERSIVRYDYNDYFKMSFGKYHTPIGYWNDTFHHGAWLQTTISRPEMVKFGGTFTPIHFVGILAEGNIPSGGLGLAYSAGLGNGRSSLLSKAGDSGDINDNRAWVASVLARPSWLYGLQFGGAVYRDKLTPMPGQNFDEWIESAHLVWTKEHPEFLSEFSNVHHRDLQTLQTYNSQAFYVQLAYRLPWQENKWKPYYRFEYIHRPNIEPVWDITGTPSVTDLVGSTVGLRYDITNYAAFKGEYRNYRPGVNEPRVNGAFFQTAFTF
jgi:hypothetical protein